MGSNPCWRAGATASAGTVIAMTDIPRLFGLTAVIQSCIITPTRLLLVTHRVTEPRRINVCTGRRYSNLICNRTAGLVRV